MKLVLIGLLCALGLESYPPPFPRQDVSKVFENELVVVWDGRWTKGRASPMHEHVLDLAGVILKGGRTKVTFPDGSIREGQRSQTGDAVFQPKGLIHVEEPLVDGARTIGIELKDVSVPKLADRTDLPRAFPRDGATLLIDNSRVAIWDYQWVAGRAVALHFHDRSMVVVPIQDGEVRYTSPDGVTDIERQRFGEVIFRRRGETHQEEVTAGSPRAIVVELK